VSIVQIDAACKSESIGIGPLVVATSVECAPQAKKSPG